jgi:hypothetical protein
MRLAYLKEHHPAIYARVEIIGIEGNAKDLAGAFKWTETIEGLIFWGKIDEGDFDIFYTRYPLTGKNRVTIHKESFEDLSDLNTQMFQPLSEVNLTDSFIDDERKELFRSTEESVKAIKEHQNLCKKVIEISNMTDSEMEAVFEKEYERQEARLELIDKIREVVSHIPDNKLAGYPEELRKLAEQLVAL